MKRNFKNFRLALFSFVVIAAINVDATAQNVPSDIIANLNSYNVNWHSASSTGSAGSMPIGNGDITSNVWVEKNGDLLLYLGKSDNWSEGTRLLKTGKIRISLFPNPFISGTPFQQELNLYKGEINIVAGVPGAKVNIKLWIDANHPVIHIEASGEQKFSLKCKTEIMRPVAYTLPLATDSLADSFRGVTEGVIKPSESADMILPKENMIGWYHRNTSSMFSTILSNENLKEAINSFPDPYINRTFGALIKGVGMSKSDNYTLQSKEDLANYILSIYSFTTQTKTLEEWEHQFDNRIIETEATPMATAYTNHGIWWDNFWNRSWVFISGDADATSVTRAYLLQRYMMACMGRGKHPVKFNGGTFTFDYQGKDGDFRNWGPGYWNQNSRHLYWPMLSSGDYDVLMPWFDCYMNMLPLQKAHTQKLYNHEGAFFPETFNFFGLNALDDWGWGNTGTRPNNEYIRYHYSNALEVIAQMLEYYYYTKNDSFIANYIVPFSTEAIRFFDKHYPREKGKIKFYPANALETYWDCTNPTDFVAGLHYTIPRLCSLPGNSISKALKDEWNNCLSSLPAIPFDAESLMVKVAEIAGDSHNSENPDCYAIFPYKIYGIGRNANEIGIETFGNRKVKLSTCWAPDPIWAALVGMTDVAQQAVIDNSKSVDTNVRFPAFWASRNDYMPDLDNGGALMMGLQNMLIQNVDSLLYVLPSWPSSWNVDYKLQSYDNTTIRLISKGVTINQLDVFPSKRLKNIVLPTGKQNQSLFFPALPVTKLGEADFEIKAMASSELVVTYTSSNNKVAKIVGTKVKVVGIGTAIISAMQIGNDKFNASPAINRKLIVQKGKAQSLKKSR